MNASQIHESEGQRTFVAVLDTGDEVSQCIKRLAAEQKISAARLTAIGAFSDAVIAYFDWESKDYREIPIREQVEVAALLGDIALGADDAPVLHVHVVLGRQDGSAVAGHLARAHVRPTLEVIITESPAHLRRKHDPTTGLALIDLQGTRQTVASADPGAAPRTG